MEQYLNCMTIELRVTKLGQGVLVLSLTLESFPGETLHSSVGFSAGSTTVQTGVELGLIGGSKHTPWADSRMATDKKSPWFGC